MQDPWSLEDMTLDVVTLRAFLLIEPVAPGRVGLCGSRLYGSCAAACQSDQNKMPSQLRRRMAGVVKGHLKVMCVVFIIVPGSHGFKPISISGRTNGVLCLRCHSNLIVHVMERYLGF